MKSLSCGTNTRKLTSRAGLRACQADLRARRGFSQTRSGNVQTQVAGTDTYPWQAETPALLE